MRRNGVSKGIVTGVVLAVAALGAGCAGDAEPQVATARSEAPAQRSEAAADPVTAYLEAKRGYVKCLRDEGVKVSDPDPKGKIEFLGDLRTLKQDPAFVAAQRKCHPLLPPVPKELREAPALTPEQIDAARRYARCMRENGAPDFPDPDPEGSFGGEDGGPGWNQGTDGAARAGVICGPIVGAPASPGPGQG